MSRPLKGVAYEFYVALTSQSTGLLQANPTLASGDVKVSKDGATFNNLGTLPTVSPASGVQVKVSLSATEMNADSVAVLFQDAAGAEWSDYYVEIQTHPAPASTVDDASFSPTTTAFETDLTETTADHYNNQFVFFISGLLAGQSRKISDYDGTNKRVTVATALTEAPSDGDKFIILGRSE